jgi:hypothetical protein
VTHFIEVPPSGWFADQHLGALWPALARTAPDLVLCAAVGFTISIPLAFLGVTGIWAGVVALPLVLAYLYWRDIRD